MNYELRVMRPSPTLPVREGDWATNYELCIINLHYYALLIINYALFCIPPGIFTVIASIIRV
jgi:hypothetical protein